MSNANLAELVSAHESLFTTYTGFCHSRSAEELATQSLCPDWDARSVIAHTIGIETVLDGWAPSAESPPPFEKMNEFAATIADLEPDQLASKIDKVTSSRLDHLRSLVPEVIDTPAITPIGVTAYGRFLRIRVFDLWVHAHDIATPLGRSVQTGRLATELTLDEVAASIGYIVGKKVGLPDGRSAVVHVTGEVERDIAVVVDGKAIAVDAVDDPDVELTTDVETFVLLAAGRVDPQARIDDGRITWSGDAEWGERLARNLAYTI